MEADKNLASNPSERDKKKSITIEHSNIVMRTRAIIVLIIFSQLLSCSMVGTKSLVAEAGGDQAPILANNSPSDRATEVYTNPRLSVNVRDPEGELVSIWFSTNASGT